MRYFTGTSSSVVKVIMRKHNIESIKFKIRKIEYTITDHGYYNALNSNGTQFEATVKALDNNEELAYIVLHAGSIGKNQPAIIYDFSKQQVVEVMKWHEMQSRYLSEFFNKTKSNETKIKELQAKQALLQAEIDRLQAEIDSLS